MMKLVVVGVMGLILVGGGAGAMDVQRLYVSAKGNDDWSGTLAKSNRDKTDGPFASLTRAQLAVREFKKTVPVEVVVQSGTYRLSKPLEFSAADSGTASCPVTYRAQGEVVISGGEAITGWQKGEDGIWTADVPDAKDGKWNFRLLRVGRKWATRARHPNFDAKNPLTGGWLFAGFHGEPWEKGLFGSCVGNLQEVGTRLTWRFQSPAAGDYTVWMRYGSAMKEFQLDNMGGRTALRLDGGNPTPIPDLPDTGGWGKLRWMKVGLMSLSQGEHTMQWENLKGGGLSMDAFCLCDDESWDPEKAYRDFTWWGTYTCDPPAQGKHVILIQAEACEKTEGQGITVPKPTPGGSTENMRFRKGDLPKWPDMTGAVVHVFPGWGWVNAIIGIDRIDYADSKIIFAGGAGQDVRIGNRYFVENVREALDAPGEWYLDTKSGKLLYIPEKPMGVVSGFEIPKHLAVAPRLDRLITLDGGADFVEHINFEGFTFTDTDHSPTGGYYSPDDSTIRMSKARHCAVRNCRFEWLGGYALRLDTDSQFCEFTGNDLDHLGHGGVIMTGENANHAHHNLVAGNVMRNLGLIYKHVAGVYVTTGDDNRIVHNTISDVTRYGISLKSYNPVSSSHNNIVEYNDIRRTNLETNDTGAIETLGCHRKETGNVLRYNLILDTNGLKTDNDGKITTPCFSWGIYLDDFSSGTTVCGNIIARTDWGGICIHGGKNNVFENNVFVDSHTHQVRLQPRDEFMNGNRFVRNVVAYSRPESDLIYSYRNKVEQFTEWDNNLYWLKGTNLTKLDRKNTPVGSFADWLKAGFDAHSKVADPLFVDSAHDDYSLRPDSPAFKLGFKPIPVEKIGADYWRKYLKK